MEEDCFTLDVSGHKYIRGRENESPSSRSLSSESLSSQPDVDNHVIKEDAVDLEEDAIVLNHAFTENDEFISSLRTKVYGLISSESFCRSFHVSDNVYSITLCKNGLTNRLNEMSFLLRHNCGRSYPRFLRYTKVPLSKHVIQSAKRYYANIPDLTSSKNCPEPIMDFTHCLSSLYLLPKDMCTGCGRRDCRKTWHSNRPCDYHPCDSCGQFKHHQCRYIHDLTTRRNQRERELPQNVRDYLAGSLRCLVCGRTGHANCATNAPSLSSGHGKGGHRFQGGHPQTHSHRFPNRSHKAQHVQHVQRYNPGN